MSKRIYVGTRKGLFIWSKGDAGKYQLDEVAFLGEPITMLLPDDGQGNTYAVLSLGHFGTKLRVRGKEETDWRELGVPVYPEGARVNAGHPVGDTPPDTKPASLIEIWSLESGGKPGVLWAGTIPGGLFKSLDGGVTWDLVETLWNKEDRWRWFGGGKDDPGIHSVSVHPQDSSRVSVAISCGGVWRTADGGETWEGDITGMRAEFVPPNLAYDPAIQDAHRLSRCQSVPDTMWVQHHNGIFLSRDGGKAWQELETAKPSAFGFAVAAHPKDPDTAWFVPATVDQVRVPVDAKFVVSRTRDGGKSFEVLHKGLPTEPCYDIVYRHALDVDDDGKMLAVGSTTGGLWVSDNAGDDWQMLSHTLPPIYCVRLGA